MDTHRTIRRALLAAALGAFGVCGVALAVDEVEPNSGISTESTQPLTLPMAGSITVNGIIGRLDCPTSLSSLTPEQRALCKDVDFYSFFARKDTVITFDIDGGMKVTGRDVDTILTLFKPARTQNGVKFYEVDTSNDDAGQPLDQDSTHPWDARIDKWTLGETGTYTLAVTGFPGKLANDGIWAPNQSPPSTGYGATSVGSYNLVITVEAPPVQHIKIEIKPGSGEYAPINPKSNGVIPVALLGSSEFDALSVDPTTLTFGATGDEKSWLRCAKKGEDVNGDTLLDLVCHFGNRHAFFSVHDTVGIIKGQTKPEAGGTLFEGRGNLKVVPVKWQD